MNSIMYADDLILISISLKHMQSMVDLCFSEFEFIGMNINVKKSGCLRIGPRHRNEVSSICINTQPLKWLRELKYLGIHLLSATRFTFNLQVFKQKYYRALNGIFGKIGVNSSSAVLCSLIKSFCVPILMYAAESLNWTQKQLKSVNSAYSHAFYKVFSTFDNHVVEQCQYYMGCLPMSFVIDIRKLNEYDKIFTNINHPMHTLCTFIDNDFHAICERYNIAEIDNCNRPKHRHFYRDLIWTSFASRVL